MVKRKNEDFNIVCAYIDKCIKDYVAEYIYNEGLGYDLMFVYVKKSKHEIFVFDKNCGINEIARISYSINDRGVFISDLIVDEDFQRNGIGKNLFNTAAIHGNKLGSKVVYGYVSPISAIKGISSDSEFSFLREKAALTAIYEKMGCEVRDQDQEAEFTLALGKGMVVSKEIESFVDNILDNEDKNEK